MDIFWNNKMLLKEYTKYNNLILFYAANHKLLTGIHIRSRPVVPDDSKAAWTSEITPKVVLWMSKVLLNHNIVSKFSYDVIMYLSLDHFSST